MEENIMVIEFSIRNQVVKREDKNQVVENSENYLKAKFNFSDDWRGLKKQAHFTWNGLAVYYVDIDDENLCSVPSEVIKARGFEICIQGREASGKIVKVTTTPVQVMVLESGLCGELIPAITTILSDTLLVSKDANKVTIEIPNIYVTKATYDESTGNLVLIGLNDEVVQNINLPIKSILDGNLAVKKAECDSNGNIIIETYATKAELNQLAETVAEDRTYALETFATKNELGELNEDLKDYKQEAENTYSTKQELENLDEKVDDTALELQTQIDAIVSKSDVVAIVGTKAQLDLFDKSKLGDNDIIKVLKDETRDNAQSYYQFKVSTQAFTWIGSIAESYTKAESDELLSGKLDKVTSDTGTLRVYTISRDGKNQTTTEIEHASAKVFSIVMRNGNGEIITVTPTTNNSATTKKYVDDALGGKLDKVTSSGVERAYVVGGDGKQYMIPIQANESIANSMVRRKGDGNIATGTPQVETDATPKSYVDNLVNTSVIDLPSGTTTYQLADNKIYKIGGEALSFTPTFPSGIDESYVCEVRFTSGAVPTEIGASNNDTFDGFDCEAGDFVPMPYTSYKMIYSKGVNGMTVIVARG